MAWDDFPRVSILKEPKLPLDVAAAVAGRVRWLRHDVEAIDAELRLRYPPIEIVPVAWIHELRDGTFGYVPGCVRPRPYEAVNRYVVQISAPVLMEYRDDLIRGILAHEFLHVVYRTLDAAQYMEADPSTRTSRKPGEHDYAESWAHYRRIDAEWQVDASAWLSPRLQRLEALADVESPVDVEFTRIKSNWVDKGLPVEKIGLELEAHGIAIDRAIVERAATLAKGAD